jgi:hypothetical protein
MTKPLRPIQEYYYGDDSRWFVGTVIHTHPPPGLEGRVKIRIIGIHSSSTSDIPERDLPWAQVLIPTTEGGISGFGKIPLLLPNSMVFGIFLDGISSQLPLVLGSVPRNEYPTFVQKYAQSQTREQNVYAIDDLYLDSERIADTELRRKQSMKFFIDNGYTPVQAAGISGVLEASSRFTLYGQNGKGTIGIASWENTKPVGSRFLQLVDFASSFNPKKPWQLMSTQLQFVLYELRNRFNFVNGKLLRANNLEESGEIVNKYYLGKSVRGYQNFVQTCLDEVMEE